MTLEILQAVVKDASALMIDNPAAVMQKAGYENIVTSSDLNVQEYLKKRLSALMPASEFLCEESDLSDGSDSSDKLNRSEMSDSSYTWIIDPIDGTANYARGLHQCAVSVALAKDGETVMGAVYLPRTAEMFTAEKGCGAKLNGRPIHVSNRVFADSILFTALPVYHKEHTCECAAIIAEAFSQCNDVRRLGAAAPELCYVAAGRCELYFEYLLSPWDFAAASLILTEAGGSLLRPDGAPLDPILPSGVIAANSPENLTRLYSIVKKYLI